MANHLETLAREYLEMQGYLVRTNINVGRRAAGGWEMELDVVAYSPATGLVLHYEPSLDALPWEKRELRYAKKLTAAKKYIASEVLPHLPIKEMRHIAVLPNHPAGRDRIAGFELQSTNELMDQIKAFVGACGKARKSAISEEYPLLRTLQFAINGY